MATALDFRVKNGLVVSTTATILTSTNAVSTVTGALQVAGGAGIGLNLWVGGTIFGSLTGTATTATNLAGGAGGSIPYQTAAGITTMLSVATTAGWLLRSTGSIPQWSNPNDLTAGNASAVNTVARTTNAAHYLTFVDSNNASAGAEAVYTTSSFVVNPATGNVGIGTTAPTTPLTVGNDLRTTSEMTIWGEYQTSIFNNTNILNFRHGGFDRFRLSTTQSSSASNDFNFNILATNSSVDGHNNLVIVKGLTGNVGIGTTSPASRLDVNGDITIADKIIHSGDTNTAIRFPAADTFTVETSGVERLRVNSVGSVGIGTTTPQQVFEVFSSTTANLVIGGVRSPASSTGESWSYFTIRKDSAGTVSSGYGAAIGGYLQQGVGGGIGLFVLNGAGLVERLRINTLGNVGIGTTTPITQLDVSGGTRISGVTTVTNTTNATSTTTGALQVAGGAGIGRDLYVGGTIYGNINGTVTGSITGNAATVSTVARTTNAVHYLTFVDSNNSSATAESVYTTSSFTINPASGDINVGTTTVDSSITVNNTTTSALNLRSNARFISPNSANTITVRMLDSDVLTFSGAAGQLFSISDSFTGTIFAVNDISGVPSIEVYDTGLVSLAEFVGNVGIGTTSTIAKLDVNGNTRISGITTVTNNTNATSTVTGALQVAGGVGIGGNLYVGGEIVAQKLTIQLTTITTTLVQTDDIIQTLNTTNATSTTTGALLVAGGAGVGRDLYVGGTIYGNLNGTVTGSITGNAATVSTVARTTNTAHFLTFVDSNNASAGAESVYTTSSFVVNPATGNVGIGTNSPSALLTVGRSTIGDYALFYGDNAGGGRGLKLSSSTFSNVGDTHTFDALSVTGGLAFATSSIERMRVASNGNVGIGTTTPTYRLEVNGSFAATTKSFRIDHPSKPGMKLQYGSLESPYHGIRLTGRGTVVKGRCVLQLPDYVNSLVKEEGINIQITNYKHSKTLYVDDIDLQNNCFTVAGSKIGKLEFFWTFTAVRKDIPSLEVECYA